VRLNSQLSVRSRHRPSTWPARVSGKQVVVYLASLLILEIVPFLDVAFF